MLADVPSPAVHLSQLMTGWQFHDPYAVVALSNQAVALVLYGVALILRSTTIAPEHTLGDTHAGGVAFLIGSVLISIAASMVMFIQWSQKRARQSTRNAALRVPFPD